MEFIFQKYHFMRLLSIYTIRFNTVANIQAKYVTIELKECIMYLNQARIKRNMKDKKEYVTAFNFVALCTFVF